MCANSYKNIDTLSNNTSHIISCVHTAEDEQR